MKNKTVRFLRAAAAMLLAAMLMMTMSGCLNAYTGKPSADAAPATPEDEQAARDVIIRYLDAFCAKDAQAMADTMCSPVRLAQLQQANGATEEDFLKLMQENLKNMDLQYGADSYLEYDPESIKSENADEYIDLLNDEFRVDRESGLIVDMARVVSATVWMNTTESEDKVDVADGSMLVYRYDGQWYIYGSAQQ